MNAAIIAVGSEMLTPTRIDTNSLYLTEKLNALGVEVVQKLVMGDHRGRLEASISFCLEQAEILIISGGLGPTEDDLTRESVAAALGRELLFDEGIVATLEARFASFGRKMAEINKRQAYLVSGGEALANPNGTAPGQWIPLEGGKIVILVPGPPGEMKPLFEREVLPRLEKALPKQAIATLTLRIAGLGESDVDALTAPVYKRYENPVTTILAKAGDITLHFRAQCPELGEAERLVREVGEQVKPLLGEKLYSDDGSPLEQAVLRLLEKRGESVAVAESLTGGMMGSRFAAIPGASKTFVGGFLVYTNEQKVGLLGVDASLIAEHTEVSEAVAIAMAQGALQKTGAAWAVSLTGYAGPDGGTDTNPVGTVFVGVASKSGVSRAQRFRFPAGDRERTRQFATQAGLNQLRLDLM